jgi:serine/threonine protein phosphatase PrpC
MVNGLPLMDGEFDLGLQWSFADVPSEGKATGTCRLTSNPDPRTLWKVIEPAADLPYRKAHLDQKTLKGAGFTISAASRRGRSHEHGGSFRDDDFFISDDQQTGWSVLIVADGAGSAKSSREGSRIAVETAGRQLVDSLAGDFGSTISGYLATWDSDPSAQNAIGKEFHYSFYNLAKAAIQAIEDEAAAQNASTKEYSTTLLVAAVKKDGPHTFLATFWMGDGAIAAYGPRGTVKLMGTPDGGEFAGQTRFLDRNALADQGFGKRVKVGRFQNISAVILMTDGVSDPYFETDNGLANAEKWDVLWDEIQPQLCNAEPEQRLVEWLHFFKQGHHDDRTIAVLW